MTTLERWVLILLMLILAIAWNYAIGKEVAVSEDHSAKISLHNEACTLPQNVIRNLPFRVVWIDRIRGNKAYEGCFGIKDSYIIMYFEDGSIALTPVGSFSVVRSL